MTRDEELRTHRRRGWWIRIAREGRGITLAALADALGYQDGQGTVSMWERGARPVPSGKFPAIAQLLDLPAAYLVTPPTTDEERLEADRLGVMPLAAPEVGAGRPLEPTHQGRASLDAAHDLDAATREAGTAARRAQAQPTGSRQGPEGRKAS